MEELDFVEKSIIKALTISSVFSFGQIHNVYRKVKSFDKTIACLKLAAAGMKMDDVIYQAMQQREDATAPVKIDRSDSHGNRNNASKELSAEGFVKKHFKNIDKATEWYPAIVAIAEGYAKYTKSFAEK